MVEALLSSGKVDSEDAESAVKTAKNCGDHKCIEILETSKRKGLHLYQAASGGEPLGQLISEGGDVNWANPLVSVSPFGMHRWSCHQRQSLLH